MAKKKTVAKKKASSRAKTSGVVLKTARKAPQGNDNQLAALNGDAILVAIPNKAKVTRMEKMALERLEQAKGIQVRDAEEYACAAIFAKGIKEVERLVGELYDEHVAKAHAMHKGLTEARGRLLKPLKEAREITQREMSSYDLEQRRLQEEKAREEAEAQRQEEIKAAKKAKDHELVEELKETPIELPEITEPVVPVQSGVSSRKITKWKVVDEALVPRQYLMLDEKAINNYVKLAGMGAVIPGIEVYEDVQTVIR